MIRVSKWKRPNGHWYVRYWVNGRKIDDSARTRDEPVAESHRVRREIEINAGIEPVDHGDMGELIPVYLDSMPPKTTANHRLAAERILRRFMELTGRRRRDGSYRIQTQQVNPEVIDRFIHRRVRVDVFDGSRRDSRGRRIVRRRQISNMTLKSELRYLSGFFNWCCRQRPRYLRENPIPLSSAARLRSDAKPHFMVTEDELRLLLEARENVRQYLFLLLGWWTGGRRREILALHYYHFDFEAHTLDMRHFKNNMSGLLPVSDEIIDIVKRLYEQADEAEAVFPKAPLPSHGFERLCRKAGVRHHRFHDFRISTSTVIKSGGFDASLAGLWVGNRATTNRAHYTDLTAAARGIGSLLEVPGLPPVPWQNA